MTACHSTTHVQVNRSIPAFHCTHGDDQITLRLAQEPVDAQVYLTGTRDDILAWTAQVIDVVLDGYPLDDIEATPEASVAVSREVTP